MTAISGQSGRCQYIRDDLGIYLTLNEGQQSTSECKLPEQSIVKVPRNLIKVQQDVVLAIDIFFVKVLGSKEICFTTTTHLVSRNLDFLQSCRLPYH